MSIPRTLPFLLLGVAACDPYSPNLGHQPFRCGTDEPRCPDGYVCMEYSETEHVCEAGEPPDSPDARGDGGGEECNNDSAIEPNNTTNQAWTTPIPANRDCISLVSLAVCPAGDVDLYRFGVEENGKNLKAEVTANLGAGALTLRVLNNAGSPVANGQAVDGDTLQLIFNNMAVGVYYVEVAAPEDVTNNYIIDIFTCDETSCSATTTCTN
jgi:hypothetical protein